MKAFDVKTRKLFSATCLVSLGVDVSPPFQRDDVENRET